MMPRWIVGSAFKTDNAWGFWFHVFGYGLAVSNLQPMFSKRPAYKSTLVLFGVKIIALTPPPVEKSE